MITENHVSLFFGASILIEHGVYRGDLVLGGEVRSYYFSLATGRGKCFDYLAISKDCVDDDFGRLLVGQHPDGISLDHLTISPLSNNKYGFSHVLIAPPKYHRELAGSVFESVRESLILCIPVMRWEFAGDESVDDFFALRRHIVTTSVWRRTPEPRISIRQISAANEHGEVAFVVAAFEDLSTEIRFIQRDPSVALEIKNYMGSIMRVATGGIDGNSLCLSEMNSPVVEVSNIFEATKVVRDFLTCNPV